ncbi:efflux RND transporter periplasmic adaptor subunit [Jannaschia aquimarina]|uniref:BepF protein n=1 Tax=Jannaschia aquimarina TaxID=935700 RepID=A0A0D1CSX5_9RHOB|nr:efflux RND transporter periplasmic adaptor subunit [Jannaschia aquimarina]KIT17857.1 Efflux pump periplasmic linker BepF [Jannaschia aquimarina]SNS56300.1 RND family efflux transporter, MFP subunit [Jannaschia aquimarina]
MTEHVAAPAKRRPLLRRLLTLSFTTLIVVGAFAGGTVLYGALATRASISDAPPPAPPLPVTSATIQMQDGYEVSRRFAGQIEADQETSLGFEESGTLEWIGPREGEVVERGEILARLDTRLLEAERDRLQSARTALAAQVDLAERTNTRQAELRERGFATDQRVDDTSLGLTQLQARLAEADAGLTAIDVRLSKAELRAPYSGTIGTRLLDAGAVVSPGGPVLTLLEGGPSRFRVGVDPRLASVLPLGETAVIDTDAGRVTAKLTQIAPDLDPATRTRTLWFEVEEGALPARTTGELTLTQTLDGRGAWMPLSALRQGPRGSWQIVTVVDGAAGPVAGIEAVEIIAQADGRAFVRGTFDDGTRYLTEGVHRIVTGERLSLGEGA